MSVDCQCVAICMPLMCHKTLHWRHNDHDCVSNHQPHGCLLNRLFRRRSKKTSKLRVTGLCVGNSPGPVNSPHKGPVTRKIFPFDDVIMKYDVTVLSGHEYQPKLDHEYLVNRGHVCSRAMWYISYTYFTQVSMPPTAELKVAEKYHYQSIHHIITCLQ